MDKNSVKYSCIIPCYNASTTIDRCINSLCSQNFTDFEVIFIDDCSLDNTYTYIKEKQKVLPVHSILLSTPKNGGPGAARNLGIDVAHGKYLVFMDSDDWYEYNFFSIIDDALCDSGVDALFFNFYYTTISGKKKKISPYSKVIMQAKEWYIANAPDSLCRCVFRKNIFTGIFIPSIYNGEDIAVIPLLFSNAHEIKYINEYLYNYCFTPKSLSNTNGYNVVLSLIAANEIIEEAISEQYSGEVEFIGIKNVLYSAVFVSCRSRLSDAKIERVICDFSKKHPYWPQNKYIQNLPLYKRMFLLCVKYNWLFALRAYSFLHAKLLNK